MVSSSLLKQFQRVTSSLRLVAINVIFHFAPTYRAPAISKPFFPGNSPGCHGEAPRLFFYPQVLTYQLDDSYFVAVSAGSMLTSNIQFGS